MRSRNNGAAAKTLPQLGGSRLTRKPGSSNPSRTLRCRYKNHRNQKAHRAKDKLQESQAARDASFYPVQLSSSSAFHSGAVVKLPGRFKLTQLLFGNFCVGSNLWQTEHRNPLQTSIISLLTSHDRVSFLLVVPEPDCWSRSRRGCADDRLLLCNWSRLPGKALHRNATFVLLLADRRSSTLRTCRASRKQA